MKNLLYKEFYLATPPLTLIFLSFTLMTFVPGYPILCGAFFVCFGIFQSYQLGREDNDILYTVLLPVRKTDAVRAKYLAALTLQMAAFFLFFVFTLVRMVFLSESKVYLTNALMGANLIFLAFVLVIFASFNAIFIGGFFKTAYSYGKPFIAFIIECFVIIGIAETLHHLPSLDWTNSLAINQQKKQIPILLVAIVLYFLTTFLSCKISQKRFEGVDL